MLKSDLELGVTVSAHTDTKHDLSNLLSYADVRP